MYNIRKYVFVKYFSSCRHKASYLHEKHLQVGQSHCSNLMQFILRWQEQYGSFQLTLKCWCLRQTRAVINACKHHIQNLAVQLPWHLYTENRGAYKRRSGLSTARMTILEETVLYSLSGYRFIAMDMPLQIQSPHKFTAESSIFSCFLFNLLKTSGNFT
jgi:hypothetical protein